MNKRKEIIVIKVLSILLITISALFIKVLNTNYQLCNVDYCSSQKIIDYLLDRD